MNASELLALELHKPMIEKLKKRKIYAGFEDNIWAADLAEMGSLSSKNQGLKYLLCVIDVFNKYAWVKPLTDKKSKTVFNDFTGTVNESKRKSNKLWVDHGRGFCNNIMQK